MPPAQAAQALGSFENVKRRMELRGRVAREAGSITVYDDFAHHPSAIRTTLEVCDAKSGRQCAYWRCLSRAATP